jgi:predicted PurR-regulated permease PerM
MSDHKHNQHHDLPPAILPATADGGLFSPVTRVNIALLCIIFLLFSVVWFTQALTGVIAMLAVALILTYLLLGPVRVLESTLYKAIPKPRRRVAGLRRTLAIVCVYILFLGGCSLAVLRVAPALTLQVKEFGQEFPSYLHRLDQFLFKVESGISLTTGDKGIIYPSASSEPVAIRLPNGSASQLHSRTVLFSLGKVNEISQKTARVLLNVGAGALNGLIYSLTALMLAFYLLSDGQAIQSGLINLVPTHREEGMRRFLHRANIQLYKLVKAQAVMGMLSGSIIYLLLSVLQVKYALLLGVLFGIASLPPVIGPWLGLLPLTLILALGGHPAYIVSLLIAAGLFHAAKIYWLWPRILHARYHIHPILFIVTFLLCLNTVGWVGIFLSFPLACVLGVCLDMIKSQHREHERQSLIV